MEDLKELNENLAKINANLEKISVNLEKLGLCVTYYNSVGRDRYVFNAAEPTLGRLGKNKFLKGEE